MIMPAAPEAVITALQTSASLHLTAVEHYQAQAAHFERWGYPKLAAQCREDAEEERGHLAKVLARLEYYDVQPTYEHETPEWPRHDYEGILTANLALETAAAEAERANILASRAVGDELSASVFVDLLIGSEDSIKKIEAIQKVLEQIGTDNYLANQV